MKKINFIDISRFMKSWKIVKSIPQALFIKKVLHIPEIIVALSYNQLYDDFSFVNPKSFLSNIPSFDALRFILNMECKVHYNLHDPQTDTDILEYLYQFLDETERKRFSKYAEKHKGKLILINAEGTMRFVRLSLSCFTPERVGFVLNDNDKKNIFKAYLYCNQIWTSENIKINNMTFGHGRESRKSYFVDLSLKLDVPISEFKLFKDFRTQFYKAIKFFEFAEKDCLFSKILPIFCADRGVADWKEYIRILFGFFEPSLNTPTLDMHDVHPSILRFMDSYLVDTTSLPNTDTLLGQIPRNSRLRDKFLLRSTNNPNLILILSNDLLVDKFYQGLKFDFVVTANNHDIVDDKGKEINQIRLNTILGDKFSEEGLLYNVINMIYSTNKDIFRVSGSEIKDIFKNDEGSEPDYYFRKENELILFENKDVLFPDTEKFSGDLLRIKESITKKLATFYNVVKTKTTKTPRKGLKYYKTKSWSNEKEGIGQIFYNIYRMAYKPNLYETFDPEFCKVDKIYPVLITSDKAYSSIGVNEYVNKKVSTIKTRLSKYYKNKFGKALKISQFNVQRPVIIDLDTLIMYSLILNRGSLDIFDLINEYNGLGKNGEPILLSFYTFMMDYHKIGAQGNDFIQLLYGDIIETVEDGLDVNARDIK